MSGLRVVRSGTLCTVQDLGRPGWFHAGVGVSGAADRRSLRLANRLVGNNESAAVLELLLGGMELETEADTVLAVTGAPAPISVDGRAEPTDSVLFVRAGQRMRIGVAAIGMRSYVAVRGGVDVPPVLGSRSRDTLAGLGPEPLRAGAVVPVGAPGRSWPNVEVAPVPPVGAGTVVARVVPGPRAEWFQRPDDLFAGCWRVSADADRVGARLERVRGPALIRRDAGELLTEGMALGSVQVPPSGQPVVFLADHPITGGYPVIGTVVADDVDLLAQARPGQRVVFRPVPAWG